LRVQTLAQSNGMEIQQTRFVTADGRVYLVRAVAAVAKQPPVVVTVYRTSKIEKYWIQGKS
jgi:hypothetical protein